jgi:peptidoglycan/xylan/chitin deacetylase (PgdA/CDA1 family)
VSKSLAARLAGACLRVLPPQDGWVLCWHLVDGGVGGPVDLPRATFEAQLDELVATGHVRPLEHVASTGDGIALTFDDAFANFADVVWPLVLARGLPATLFVPTGFVDGTRPSPLSTGQRLRPCSWSTLATMAGQGLSLGSHSVTHRDLRTVNDDELDAEVAQARARITEQTGQVPRAFCYPQAKWDARVERVIRRHHDVVVTGGGTRSDGTTPWRTPRVSLVRGGPSLGLILRAPIEPREWLGDRVRRRRRS